MDNIIKAGKWLLQTLFYIFSLANAEIRKLMYAAKWVEPEYRVLDFMAVFKPTRVFFIFNLLALFIFLLLPQGKDVLLIVTEDLAARSPWSLFSLLLGIAGWSVVAEFGGRYKLYITDNSAFSISAERVEYRKQLQRFFSMAYLMLPFLIVLISVFAIALANIHPWDFVHIWPFALCLAAITFLLKVISQFYLDSKTRSAFAKKSTGLSRFLILPAEELAWTNKLMGIYNDFVLRIRHPQFFKDVDEDTAYLRRQYSRFIELVLEKDLYSDANPDGFPNHYVVAGQLPDNDGQSHPPQKKLLEYNLDFSDPQHFKRIEDPTGSYRWIYQLKPSFYKHLHRQVFAIAVSSLAVLLLIPSPFNILSDHIGAPALVCLSFGCWQGIYVGLLYLDACAFRKFPISMRWGILTWLLFCSYFNLDHPVRTIYNANPQGRPGLMAHFDKWKMDHENLIYQRRTTLHTLDSIGKLKDSCKPQNSNNKSMDSCYPVVFITAEGGALRTGAFTAMLLAALQDSFPGFRDDIYSFSSISGGTLGVSFFNAISYLDTPTRPANGYYTSLTRRFFAFDQLSPVLSKMFYGDPISSLSLWPIPSFDRAIALETAWQEDYRKIFAGDNIYSMDFLARYHDTRSYPAWFINTTEVETGLQCYLSNVRPDSFIFNDQRDLLAHKIQGSVRYSTAINFSSRFPLISPSAALRQDEQRTFHYVDGGYVENTGAKTMLELLTLLHRYNKFTHIKPYVLQLRFNATEDIPNTGFLNELSSILYGIYDTRNGASKTSAEMLRRFTIDTLKGCYINVGLPATSSEVPLNWVLSDRSLSNLQRCIDEMMHKPSSPDHTANQLFDLYWFDSNYVRKNIMTCPR